LNANRGCRYARGWLIIGFALVCQVCRAGDTQGQFVITDAVLANEVEGQLRQRPLPLLSPSGGSEQEHPQSGERTVEGTVEGAVKAQSGGIVRTSIPYSGGAFSRHPHFQQSVLTPIARELQMPLLIPDLKRSTASSAGVAAGLASQWLVHDEYFITLRLDAAARWSDDRPVTTTDIRFTFEMLSDARSSRWLADRLTSELKSVTIHDSLTFTLEYRQPVSESSLLGLEGFRPFAEHYWSQSDVQGDRSGWQAEPTTGPYYVARLVRGERILLRKQNDWWARRRSTFAQRFAPAGIDIYLPPSALEAWQLLDRGDIDFLPVQLPAGMAAADIVSHKAINQLELQQYVGGLWECFGTSGESAGAATESTALLLYSDLVIAEGLRHRMDAVADTSVVAKYASPNAVLDALSDQNASYGWLRVQSVNNPQSYLNGEVANRASFDCDLAGEQRQTALAWGWLGVPEDPLPGVASLSLWNVVDGGWLWIDQRRRASILRSKGQGKGRILTLGRQDSSGN